MTMHNGPKRKAPSAKPDEAAVDALEKARADAKAALTRVKEEERAKRKAQSALAKAGEALASAQTEIEQERRTRLEIEGVLAEAQTALTTVQSELKRNRQALAETKRALKEAREASETESMELPSAALGNGSAEQRVSFIVRLTIDEHGQPLRTEVEHAQSHKRVLFPALDIRRLDAFMKEHIHSAAIPEPAPLSAPSQVPSETPTSQISKPASYLRISNVQLSHNGVSDMTTLTLSPGGNFEVQVRFQLQEPLPGGMIAQASSFEIRVFAHAVAGGTSRLLATHSVALAEDVVEYTAYVQAPGLPVGIYRLVTLVALYAPGKIVAHYEGPIIQITELQQPVNAAVPIGMAS